MGARMWDCYENIWKRSWKHGANERQKRDKNPTEETHAGYIASNKQENTEVRMNERGERRDKNEDTVHESGKGTRKHGVERTVQEHADGKGKQEFETKTRGKTVRKHIESKGGG